VRLSETDELIFSPFINIMDESKSKRVDLFRYTPPQAATNYIADGSKVEEEDKKRQIARLRTDWQHKLNPDGLLTFQLVGQAGGEDKDKTTTSINAAGVRTYAIEDAKQEESEWFTAVKLTQPWKSHRFNAGVEYGVNSREDEKVTRNINAAGVTTISAGGRGDNYKIEEKRIVAYLSDEIKLKENHFLTPGIRAQQLKREAEDGAGDKVNGAASWVTPSVHYLWQLNANNNMRVSFTEAVKPAKFDDLSPVTTTVVTNTLTSPDKSGNPDLKPESAKAYELAFEHFLPRNGGVMGVNYFYRDIEDKVETRTSLEGSRFVERPNNVGDAKVWGWEFDARPRMDIIGLPELMLRFNYTKLYSKLEDTSTGLTARIKDQAPYVYNIGFDWQIPNWDAAWGLNYNYTPKYIKDPTAIATKLDPEAEQKLLDMYLYKRFTKTVALRVTASNLLDMAKEKEKYEFSSTTGRTTKYTEESEYSGRTLFFAIEARL
jgi:iron complex outermembrane receptor protein